MGCNSTHQITDNLLPQCGQLCTVQDIGNCINAVRGNPKKYMKIISQELKTFLDQYTLPLKQNLNYQTNEGQSVWKQAINFLEKQQPLPPLSIHRGLCKAAELHVNDLVNMNQITHDGSDKSNPLDRIQRFCEQTYGKTGQNIGIDFNIPNRNYVENTILGLVIDDGVKSRGHRLSIFDKDFKFYGSATRAQESKVITVIMYLSENWPQKNKQ